MIPYTTWNIYIYIYNHISIICCKLRLLYPAHRVLNMASMASQSKAKNPHCLFGSQPGGSGYTNLKATDGLTQQIPAEFDLRRYRYSRFEVHSWAANLCPLILYSNPHSFGLCPFMSPSLSFSLHLLKHSLLQYWLIQTNNQIFNLPPVFLSFPPKYDPQPLAIRHSPESDALNAGHKMPCFPKSVSNRLVFKLKWSRKKLCSNVFKEPAFHLWFSFLKLFPL